jgi:hypothetical protein
MFARVTKLQVEVEMQDDTLKSYKDRVVHTVKLKKGFQGGYVFTNRKTGT